MWPLPADMGFMQLIWEMKAVVVGAEKATPGVVSVLCKGTKDTLP